MVREDVSNLGVEHVTLDHFLSREGQATEIIRSARPRDATEDGDLVCTFWEEVGLESGKGKLFQAKRKSWGGRLRKRQHACGMCVCVRAHIGRPAGKEGRRGSSQCSSSLLLAPENF